MKPSELGGLEEKTGRARRGRTARTRHTGPRSKMSRMDREILSKFEIQKFLGKGSYGSV